MTRNASFKRMVRERMARTGERYTTARAHLLAEHHAASPDGLLPGWSRTGGLQPDLAPTANALAYVAAVGPTGRPLDEVDVLGLSGGIGFQYALFTYAGFAPIVTLTTRTDPMPQTTVAQVLARAGVAHEVHGTRSAAKAARTLDAALAAEQPVLLLVDGDVLDHGAPADGGLPGVPRIVAAVGRTGAEVLLDDTGPTVTGVAADVLSAARTAVPRSTHHAVTLGAYAEAHDPVAAALDALRHTAVGYDQPPVPSFARNVGRRGLVTWADALTSAGARGWLSVLADEEHRAAALRRTAAWIDEDLTAPGASRGLWAAWVDRVAEVVDRPALATVAALARDSERRWVELAEQARGVDPAADPSVTFAGLAASVRSIVDGEVAMLDALAGALDA